MALTIKNFVIESLKTFYEKLSTRFQETLVSGVNLKTVSGETLLGSGNVVIDWKDLSGVPSVFPVETHNHDDRYLKLSGGTLDGGITFKYGSNRTDQFIQFSSTDSSDPQTVYLGIHRPVSSYGLCYKDNNGNLYDIIHSGNYTTYTVKKDGTGASGVWGIGITGNAATATKANSIATEQGTSNAYRNIFFAYDGDKTKVVYDDDFTYNPNTNTLKIGAGTLTATNYSGNAATATTATKIGTSTIGSTTMPVYIKSGAPTAITSFPEAYLSWGGTNTAGSVTPIGMTLSSEHSANRLAFINGNALTFEYSSDAGSTWTDYGYTASIKSQVFTTEYGVPIGRANSSTEYTTNSRTRITLTAQDGTNSYVYTNPRKMLINISSSGGMQVLIEYRTGTNYKNNGAWTTFGTYTLSGWSGWNDIPLILNTLGGGSTQTSNNWQLRLTFIMTSKYADYPTSASVNRIRIFGENAWTPPSTMAATGHLYSFDVGQNATFPAAVTSTKFVKSGGTSAQFLKADGSVDSNTYAKSGHTHTGSEVKLTGYSKASSYSEISASDTVNQAIAKLEGALSGLETLLASI